jgi:hypothetical protein
MILLTIIVPIPIPRNEGITWEALKLNYMNTSEVNYPAFADNIYANWNNLWTMI